MSARRQNETDHNVLDLSPTFIAEDVMRIQSAHLGSTMGQETDRFVESFWYWNKFSKYLLCLLGIIVVFTLITALFQESAFYILWIGNASSGIEVS